MHVNTDGLHAGAKASCAVADHAHDAAGRLSRASLASGIIGDFEAAESFHQAVSAAHTRHVTLTTTHSEQLCVIGDKEHQAGTEFRAMETRNKDRPSL